MTEKKPPTPQETPTGSSLPTSALKEPKTDPFRTMAAMGIHLVLTNDPLGATETLTGGEEGVFRVGHNPEVIVNHPKGGEEVLRQSEIFSRRGTRADRLRALFGRGPLTIGSEEQKHWRELSKLLREHLDTKAVNEFIPEMREQAGIVIGEWENRKGKEVNVIQGTTQYTLGVMSKIVLGADKELSQRLVEHWEVMNQEGVKYLIDLREGSMNETLKKAMQEVDAVIDEAIQNEKERPESGANKSLLATLVKYKDDQDQPLSQEDIRGTVRTALFAGHETTSTSLAYLLDALGRYKGIKDKIKKEFVENLPKDDTGKFTASPQDLLKCTYARNVIKEILRLYPPVYGTMRTAEQDTAIAGYKIRKGEVVHVYLRGPHHRNDIWHDPRNPQTSVENFYPERFENLTPKQREAYKPFGDGQHRCPGALLAEIEQLEFLAELLGSECLLEATGEKPPQVVAAVTSGPKNGKIMMKVE